MGRHRLMCGDATVKEDVEKLMDGKKADMVFTDPPYGISVVGSSPRLQEKKKLQSIGRGVLAKEGYYRPVEGDQSPEIGKKIIELLWAHGRHFMYWGGNYFSDILPPSRGWIVWDKKNGDTTFADVELLWTSLDRSSRLYEYLWSGMRRRGDRKSEGTLRLHPTQKPVGLIVKILQDWEVGGSVLDGCGGSGTTLIACEKTGRVCRMMEIDPVYVDVIRERYKRYVEDNNTKNS